MNVNDTLDPSVQVVLHEYSPGDTGLAEEASVLVDAFYDTFRNAGLTEGQIDSLEASVNSMREFDRSHHPFTGVNDHHGKALPYTEEFDSLRRMNHLGHKLYRDPSIHNAIEVMISYVINKGWSYTVAKREFGKNPANGQLNNVRLTLQKLLEDCSLGNDKGWYLIQEETYRRLQRDGEYFRRPMIKDGKLHVRFIEPIHIRQPEIKEQVENWDDVPASIRSKTREDFDKVWGRLGIASDPDDAATELGYWYETGRERNDGLMVFKWWPAEKLQHRKVNVDANDPRGVPTFYMAACLVNYLNSVVTAMAELSVKQSEYAVVEKASPQALRENVRKRLQERAAEKNAQVSMGNRPSEKVALNTDIQINGLKVNTRNYVEVIQQLQRLIGSLRQIPEFMITNDANTGNRSSLTSAEGPFARRVAREQQLLWMSDKDLLTEAIWDILTYGMTQRNRFGLSMKIVPTMPTSETKDPNKDSKTIGDQLADRRISPQEAARRTHVDPSLMAAEWDEWEAEHGVAAQEPGVVPVP